MVFKESNESKPLMRYRNTYSCHQNHEGCVFHGTDHGDSLRSWPWGDRYRDGETLEKAADRWNRRIPYCHAKREGSILRRDQAYRRAEGYGPVRSSDEGSVMGLERRGWHC